MEGTTPSVASGAVVSGAMTGQSTSDAAVATPIVPEAGTSRDSASPTAAALPQLFVEKFVAYSPAKEPWLSARIFEDAGSAYIVGRVSRFDKKKALFQIHWVDTQFQKADKWISMSVVQRGMENYKNVMASPSKPAWKSLCQPDSTESGIVEDDSDWEEVDDSFERYDPEVVLPSSLPEVESITNMKFDPDAQIDGPTDLYQHPDGNVKTRVRPHFRHLFEHSAASSFFAYIPVYYWVEVLHQTNTAMRAHELEKKLSTSKPFPLQELMTFLGILFL
ncbi:hypothetical protein PF003_g40234 [Phytophthora fragariae]|nr:hypothetical protein PF003_g40234 [Phytophthora fragariae]